MGWNFAGDSSLAFVLRYEETLTLAISVYYRRYVDDT